MSFREACRGLLCMLAGQSRSVWRIRACRGASVPPVAGGVRYIELRWLQAHVACHRNINFASTKRYIRGYN